MVKRGRVEDLCIEQDQPLTDAEENLLLMAEQFMRSEEASSVSSQYTSYCSNVWNSIC